MIVKGLDAEFDKYIEDVAKKTYSEWLTACKKYDLARERMKQAFRAVSDDMSSRNAAMRLKVNSAKYYEALTDKERKLAEYEKFRASAVNTGWTEDELDEVILSVQF